jgi:toluene monooxygenase system ferredoxin subunit
VSEHATWTSVGTLDDVWEGEATAVDVDGHHVLIANVADIGVRAYQGMCPHQELKLIDGMIAGTTLTCSGHLWEFDLTTGLGINPGDCKLATYPVRVDDDEIFVAVEGVQPLHSY